MQRSEFHAGNGERTLGGNGEKGMSGGGRNVEEVRFAWRREESLFPGDNEAIPCLQIC